MSFSLSFLQIDIDKLSSVKTSCQQNLRDLCKLFQKEFNIDVPSINIPDLDKPLYSGSIMSLYLLSLNESISEKSFQDVDFWRKFVSKSVLQNSDDELSEFYYFLRCFVFLSDIININVGMYTD